jgi:hypothetical protein
MHVSLHPNSHYMTLVYRNHRKNTHFITARATKLCMFTAKCLETPEMLLSVLPSTESSSDDSDNHKQSYSSGSGWSAFIVLLKRTMLCIVRDPVRHAFL